MCRTRHTAEEIVAKLRQLDAYGVTYLSDRIVDADS